MADVDSGRTVRQQTVPYLGKQQAIGAKHSAGWLGMRDESPIPRPHPQTDPTLRASSAPTCTREMILMQYGQTVVFLFSYK